MSGIGFSQFQCASRTMFSCKKGKRDQGKKEVSVRLPMAFDLSTESGSPTELSDRLYHANRIPFSPCCCRPQYEDRERCG